MKETWAFVSLCGAKFSVARIYIRPVIFVSEETFGNIRKYFWLSHLRRGWYDITGYRQGMLLLFHDAQNGPQQQRII